MLNVDHSLEIIPQISSTSNSPSHSQGELHISPRTSVIKRYKNKEGKVVTNASSKSISSDISKKIHVKQTIYNNQSSNHTNHFISSNKNMLPPSSILLSKNFVNSNSQRHSMPRLDQPNNNRSQNLIKTKNNMLLHSNYIN